MAASSSQVGLSTPAARILVHAGTAGSLAAARAAPPPPLPASSPYFESLEAVPGQGLLLGSTGACLRFGDSPQVCVAWARQAGLRSGLPAAWRRGRRLHVHLTLSLHPPGLPQDVVSELGEPSSTHTKPPRAAGSHGLAAGAPPSPPDYFFSYASRGLDVLFCGTTHRLRKLVLHANAPQHPEFGLYAKCNFRSAQRWWALGSVVSRAGAYAV